MELLAARGRGPVSITDHDTLGIHRRAEALSRAHALGIELVPGIEMDVTDDGREMHVLGYGVDARDAALNAFLDAVAAARRQRAYEEMAIINDLLGAETFTEGDIFRPGRETLMKPHFIKPLLEKGRFPEYRVALKWYKENVKPATNPEKPPLPRVIALIRDAGGEPVLAHPGYYVKDDGMDLAKALPRMKAMGLVGVEVDYPYHERSKSLFSPQEARAMVDRVRKHARAAGLRETRGTDCHTQADFDESYPRTTSP